MALRRTHIVAALLCLLLTSCWKEDLLPSQQHPLPAQEPVPHEEPPQTPEQQEALPVRTGLPVLIIDTENGRSIQDKVTWVPAQAKILDAEGYVDLPFTGCALRGRGNSTWGWAKKPYSLRLDEKVEVLGMPAQKHWVLLANYMDRTLMRDALGFEIARHTSLAWTPRCQFVELVLNGRHVGNYLLAEQVRPDKNRVAIDKDAAGSWLFESDFHFDEPWQWHERNIPFCVKFPDDEDMTDALEAQARAFIKEKLDACWSGNYAKAAAAMDLQSFADYWIVFEVMGNHELRNPGSVFTYVSAGGKWTAGPVWDFDWGGLSYKTSPQAKTGLVNRSAVWYQGLFGIKDFRRLTAERWKALKPALEQCSAYIDRTQVLLRASDALNRAMWDPAGAGMINGDEDLSFNDAVARLKRNYFERISVMDSIIADGEF